MRGKKMRMGTLVFRKAHEAGVAACRLLQQGKSPADFGIRIRFRQRVEQLVRISVNARRHAVAGQHVDRFRGQAEQVGMLRDQFSLLSRKEVLGRKVPVQQSPHHLNIELDGVVDQQGKDRRIVAPGRCSQHQRLCRFASPKRAVQR